MALAQLFFKKGNYISEIKMDIFISEGAAASARVTENPIENGANTNDHIIIEPMTFNVEGVVSNISSNLVGQFTNLPNVLSQDKNKAIEAWESLLELHSSRLIFTLVQGLKSYDNVFMVTLQENQDKDTSNGLFFSATFKEIIFVGVETTNIDQFNETNTSDQMIPTTSGGLKSLERTPI